MKPSFKTTMTLFASTFICASAFAQGSGVHGVEDDWVKTLIKRVDSNAPGDTTQRQTEIRLLISSGKMKRRLYAFFTQAKADHFLPENEGHFRDRMTPQNTFEILVEKGAAEDVLKSPIEVSDSCVDSAGNSQSAASQEIPGTPICVNPKKMAELEEAVSFTSDNRAYPQSDDFFFAALMHEIARHYGMDDSHSFMLGMLKEARNQLIVSDFDCPPTSNLCDTGKPQYLPAFAFDKNLGASVYVRITFDGVALKEKKLNQCIAANVFTSYDNKSQVTLNLNIEKREGQVITYEVNTTQLPTYKGTWLNTSAYDFNPAMATIPINFGNRIDGEEFSYWLRNNQIGKSPIPCGKIKIELLNNLHQVVSTINDRFTNMKLLPWEKPKNFSYPGND